MKRRRWFTFCRMAMLIVSLAGVLGAVAPCAPLRAEAPQPIGDKHSSIEDYGRLALSFVPNAGQADPTVRYQAHGMGGTLYFQDEGVMLWLPKANSEPGEDRAAVTLVQLRLAGANAATRLASAEPLPGHVNYLIGNDPAHWHTDIPTFAGVVYQQLYPGIDLHYQGGQDSLKGTYVLAPQADPSLIRWHYAGATGLRVNERGDLVLTVSEMATLTEEAPSAWQMKAGERVTVDVRYAVTGDGQIGFAVGDYDTNAPLTIDPILRYSTFIGGSAFEEVKGVDLDSGGNAYITGRTQSNNLTVASPLDSALGGSSDAFVIKINPFGTGFVYATYLGGSADEDIAGRSRSGAIAVDAAGNAYVTGCTTSNDFPVVNAYQGTHGLTGNCDVFVSKLNQAGNALLYSTYLGGSGVDTANGIAVDSTGAAYLVGDAGLGFPVLNPLYTFLNSGHAFMTKFSPAGSVVFSTLFGGNGTDSGTGVALDATGSMYVAGITTSTNLPVVNAAQVSIGGASGTYPDAFVIKVNPAGTALNYVTYLGGGGTDEAYGIAVDNMGAAYVTGETESNLDFPTVNAVQPRYGGGRSDAFVTKLAPEGNAWIFSTYLGGNGDEDYTNEPGGIAVAFGGSAFITGETCSPDFPLLYSLQSAAIGSCFAFITSLSPAGNALVYSSLLGTKSGGAMNTTGIAITLDYGNNAFVVGRTNAADMLVSQKIQSYMGATDGFIAKLSPFEPHRAWLPFVTR